MWKERIPKAMPPPLLNNIEYLNSESTNDLDTLNMLHNPSINDNSAPVTIPEPAIISSLTPDLLGMLSYGFGRRTVV